VITALGSRKVESSSDLLFALQRYQPGESVELSIVRKDQGKKFTVQLGKHG
jgi:S1-C subfamily serine protease